jgi:toxin-antitoxin system PIN domain toxin
VTLLDANILLYAWSTTSPHRDACAEWLEDAFAQGRQIALAWFVISAFLRISTNRRLYDQTSMKKSCEAVDDLLSRSNVSILQPGVSHWNILRRLLIESQVKENLVGDAHLAALAIEHGASICTNDKDFTRFTGLRIINPIAKQ